MSTRATATATVTVDGAALGAALGDVAGLGLGLAVGAGVLIYQGAMWCGEQLHKSYNNYVNGCQQAYQNAINENLAHVEIQQEYMSASFKRLAMFMPSPSTVTSSPAARDSALQKQQEEMLSQLRATLENAQETSRLRAEAEREWTANRLRAEIQASRTTLSDDTIAAAEAALQGSQETMEQALKELQKAWQHVSAAQAQQMHQQFQAGQLLNSVRAQLRAVEVMTKDVGDQKRQAYTGQRQAIEEQMKEVEQALSVDVSYALAQAQAAERATQQLEQEISSALLMEWNAVRRQALPLRGVLATLDRMVREAVALHLVSGPEKNRLEKDIARAQNEVETLLRTMPPQVQRRLKKLEGRVDLLKEEVFRRVKTSQQRQIAEIIASVLPETGFLATGGGSPLVEESGDGVRVVALRNDGTSTARDDKVVTFEVSRDGEVSYDFSGYEGSSCLSDAEKVFAALRGKGIYLLNTKALRAVPISEISAENLKQADLLLQAVQNKPQAELVIRLKQVLEQMGFSTIRQSPIGGSIELDAFNGQIGYHVVLPSEGEAQVFKGAGGRTVDVSQDASDPVVASTQQGQAELESLQDEEQDSTSAARAFKQQQKQQLLG